MTVDVLKGLLQTRFPDGQVVVWDMTGTSDHFHVEVTSPLFRDKSIIEQHRMVHEAVGQHLTTTIHALEIKTKAP